MSKVDEIQERIRDAYNQYYEDAENAISVAVSKGEITEEEAAEIVIF